MKSKFSFVLCLAVLGAGCGLLTPEQEPDKVREQKPPAQTYEKPALVSKKLAPAKSPLESPDEAPTGPAKTIRPLQLDIESLKQQEVRDVQARLKASGFDPGPVDGIPGAKTKSALRRLQSSCSALESISELSDVINSQANAAREPALLPAPQDGNLSNEELVRVQAALKTNGFDPGPADGIFGSRTKSALLRVASGCSLARKYRGAETADFPIAETKPVLKSISEQQTETIAFNSTGPAVSPRGGADKEISILDKYAGTEEVRLVQARLKDAGFDPGPVDGILGPKTKAALSRYRVSRGISDTAVGSSTMGAMREY